MMLIFTWNKPSFLKLRKLESEFIEIEREAEPGESQGGGGGGGALGAYDPRPLV